ncbi:MFS transporter [Candidatus Microgenomates bacterium]|nr:MFS transporter [Candidatus Microgenomates bacterium]
MTQKFTAEEQIIFSQSPEVSVGEAIGWTDRFFKVFPALKSRNYQLYFSGQLISLVGTWLQIVAQSWLVLKLTNSAFLIGLTAAIATSPTLLFSLFGGVLVDRFSKRKILLLTQASSMILAFILGTLTLLNVITVWEIALLAFLLGIVNAIDAPARQSFVIEMVGKEDLHSAIALNAGIFNAARVIGPSAAGFLIAFAGISGAFIINGISYIAVIVALLFIHAKVIIPKIHPHPFQAIKEGITYTWGHPIIRVLLLFTGVVSVFGWSYTTIMSIIAQNTFHVDADGLGYLYAAAGLGALIATIAVSAFSKKVNALIFILGGSTLFSLAMVGFTFTSSMASALPFLFLAGLGLLAQFSTMNTTIQNLVKDSFRGRVMSLYVIMFMGLFPLGNFQIGFFSEHFGWQFAIRLGAAVILIFTFLVFLSRKRIAASHQRYRSKNGI